MSITYNHLNLPKRISFAGNNSITYIYNALGVKLRKEVLEADTQATTHYMGSFQYNNNTLQYIHTSEGYVRHTPPNNSVDGTLGAFDYVYNYTDHLGNVRLSYTLDPSDQVLKILEENHYYPFGMKHTYNTSRKDIRFDEAFLNPNLTPSENGNRRVEMVSNTGYQYKYNGKEYQDELGLAMYDYGARNYDPAIGRWMNIDPLAETSRRWSPYNYCQNNPIYFVDPDGMSLGDFINEAGKNIGNDGIPDGKVYVIKTTKTKFDSGVAADGISNSERKETERFIKENSGNTAAFKENNIAYKNSVEIEGSAKTRQAMVDIVNQDDGKGGTSPSNNREYGGTISNSGVVTESPPGPVVSPMTGEGTISHTINEDTKTVFHAHPSGTFQTGNVESNAIKMSGEINTARFNGAPSTGGHRDVNPTRESGRTEYVFDRARGRVYIYNTKTGVQAILPQSRFVTPKN